MIRLNVEKYCHPCLFFEAEVIEPEAIYAGDQIVHQSDTIVQCANRLRCEKLFEQFEKTNGRSSVW